MLSTAYLTNETCVQHPLPRDMKIPVFLACTLPYPLFSAHTSLQPADLNVDLVINLHYWIRTSVSEL